MVTGIRVYLGPVCHEITIAHVFINMLHTVVNNAGGGADGVAVAIKFVAGVVAEQQHKLGAW